MNNRLLSVTLVLLCFGPFLGRSALAAEPDRPQAERVYINFSGVTLESVVEYISDFTGKPVHLPDPFYGDTPVNIVSSPRAGLAPEKQIRIFATALRSAKYTMVEHEDFIQIVDEKMADDVPVREQPAETGPTSEGLVTQVLNLQNADATSLMEVLSNLKSRAGKIQAYPDTNQLVITEYGSNFQSMLAMVRHLDRQWAGSVAESYKLENTSTDSLQNVVSTYIQKLAQGAAPAVQKRLKAFSVLAHRPTNSLLLFGHAEDIAEVKQLIGKLDVKPTEAARSFHTYMVLNRDATELSKVLQSVLSAAKARGEAAESAIGVIPDQPNNAIIVITTPDRYAEILPLVKQLDRPKAQVEIQAALVEMSTNRLLDLGVELATLDGPGDRARGFAATTSGLSTLSADGRIPVPPAAGGLIAGIFKDGVFNIAALIRLSQSDEEVSLISAPWLTASEGIAASVEIADEREVQKRIISPEGRESQVVSAGFIKASIKLEITPYVNEEGTVRLKIKQTTQQFLPAEAGALANRTSRIADTEVNVPDGRTVVIAGLTGTTQITRIGGVPLLRSIPVLGFFFRRKEVIDQQRNLCVFITPRILRSAEALAAETQRRKDELKDIARHTERGLDEEALEKVTGGDQALKTKDIPGANGNE